MVPKGPRWLRMVPKGSRWLSSYTTTRRTGPSLLGDMTLGRCPLSIFCSRGTPRREVPRACGPSTREPRVPNGMAARADQAELANPAAQRRGGDPAPSSAAKMASQDRGLGGAERVDRVAAQEGGAAGAATLGAAAQRDLDSYMTLRIRFLSMLFTYM